MHLPASLTRTNLPRCDNPSSFTTTIPDASATWQASMGGSDTPASHSNCSAHASTTSVICSLGMSGNTAKPPRQNGSTESGHMYTYSLCQPPPMRARHGDRSRHTVFPHHAKREIDRGASGAAPQGPHHFGFPSEFLCIANLPSPRQSILVAGAHPATLYINASKQCGSVCRSVRKLACRDPLGNPTNSPSHAIIQ